MSILLDFTPNIFQCQLLFWPYLTLVLGIMRNRWDFPGGLLGVQRGLPLLTPRQPPRSKERMTVILFLIQRSVFHSCRSNFFNFIWSNKREVCWITIKWNDYNVVKHIICSFSQNFLTFTVLTQYVYWQSF